MDVFWRDICHWIKLYFPLPSTFVEQMEMYRWVLFMYACSALFVLHPPAFAPSCRWCPVCVCVLNVITWLKGKTFLRISLLRTQFLMFASIKGAIAVKFFCGCEHPLKLVWCYNDQTCSLNCIISNKTFKFISATAFYHPGTKRFSARRSSTLTFKLGKHQFC